MPVEYRDQDAIAHVRLDQTDRLNALSPPMADELCEAIEAGIRNDVAVMIISGQGKAFCSGYDLKYKSGHEDYAAVRRDVERIQDITRLIRRAQFPVIAAVHGYALGAGCELALCSDLIVASEDAVFGFPEVHMGLSISGGISHILPLTVGIAKAKQLVLLGERVSAREAEAMGLVNWVVPRDQLESKSLSIAQTLASQPHKSKSLAKVALDRGAQSDLGGALELETMHSLETRGSNDAELAAESFRQKS